MYNELAMIGIVMLPVDLLSRPAIWQHAGECRKKSSEAEKGPR